MKQLLALSLFSVLLYSCKKDKDSSSTGSGKLLSLAVDSIWESGNFSGTDSTVFTYDGSGRLKTQVANGIFGTSSANTEFIYVRDSKGRTTNITENAGYFENGVSQASGTGITEVVYKSGSDQIQFIYYYDATDGRGNGDSVTYEYSGSDVSATHVYQLAAGQPATLLADNTFTFNDAGELTAYTLYAQDQSQRIDYVFTYDGKINPIKVGLEQINSVAPSISPDNVAKQVAHTYEDDNVTTVNATYTYKDDGRPVSAVSSGDGSDPIIRHTHYFYN